LIYNLITSSASPLAGHDLSESVDHFTGIRTEPFAPAFLYHLIGIKHRFTLPKSVSEVYILKYAGAIVFLLVGVLSTSCTSSLADISTLSPQVFRLSKDQVVQIDVNTGEVLITASQTDSVEVLGSLTQDTALVYSVEQTSAGLHILAQYPKRIFPPPAPRPIQLEIRIPNGYQVQFDSLEADLTVKDFSGKLAVSTVAGDVLVDGLSGFAALKVNRGDVTVRTIQGELHLLGNYGLLSMEDVHGDIFASTIMGTIRYQGATLPGDRIKFESDHGPVQIDLADQPNLLVDIHSTSGEVVCMFSVLARGARNCSGMIGDGSSRLDVRTVSGNITFQQIR